MWNILLTHYNTYVHKGMRYEKYNTPLARIYVVKTFWVFGNKYQRPKVLHALLPAKSNSMSLGKWIRSVWKYCSTMDGPRGYHTKWNKSERERQIPYDSTYMWNLKYDTNEPIYKTKPDSQRSDLWLPRGRGEGGMDWEFRISRCKQLYIGWINNKVLRIVQGTISNILW